MASHSCIDPRDTDHMLDVEFKVTSPGHPGNTFGLPENCFPPEPMDIDLHFARDEAGNDVLSTLTTDQSEKVETEILENYVQDDFDGWED